MPEPVSPTFNWTDPPAMLITTVTDPPGSVNLIAFESRFQTTCWSRSGVAQHPGRVGLDRRSHGDALGGRGRRDDVNRGERDSREIDGPQFQPQLAAHHPRHVEHVVDQPHLRERVAIDHLKRAFEHRRLDRAAEEDLRPPQHSVERRPDLVRQGRQELVLHAARFFGGGSGEFGRLDLAAQLPLAGDPLADVLDRRQRADDGSLEAEGSDTGVLRDLASGRDPARKEIAVKRVREESRLAGERGSIVRLESPGHELGKGRRTSGRPTISAALKPVCVSSQRFQLRMTSALSVVKIPCAAISSSHCRRARISRSGSARF